MLRNFFFSQIVIENAKIYSAKLGYDGAIAKINSAKFTIFALVNRENKFRENLCPLGMLEYISITLIFLRNFEP